MSPEQAEGNDLAPFLRCREPGYAYEKSCRQRHRSRKERKRAPRTSLEEGTAPSKVSINPSLGKKERMLQAEGGVYQNPHFENRLAPTGGGGLQKGGKGGLFRKKEIFHAGPDRSQGEVEKPTQIRKEDPSPFARGAVLTLLSGLPSVRPTVFFGKAVEILYNNLQKRGDSWEKKAVVEEKIKTTYP